MTGSTGRALLRAARPTRWARNVLVLAVPVTLGQFTAGSLMAALAFVLASAAAYLLNAVTDQDEDAASRRAHRIPAQVRAHALTWAAVLAAGALVLAGAALPLVGAYLCLTAAYSLALRRVPYLEILVVAAGFSLRVLAGAATVGAALSVSVPLALAAGSAACTAVLIKRVSELDTGSHRAVLGRYDRETLLRWARPASIAAVWLTATSAALVGGEWPMAAAAAIGAAVALSSARRFSARAALPVALEAEVVRRLPVALGGLVVVLALVLA